MCIENDVPATAAYDDGEDSDLEDGDESEDDLEIESHMSDSSFSEVRPRLLPCNSQRLNTELVSVHRSSLFLEISRRKSRTAPLPHQLRL